MKNFFNNKIPEFELKFLRRKDKIYFLSKTDGLKFCQEPRFWELCSPRQLDESFLCNLIMKTAVFDFDHEIEKSFFSIQRGHNFHTAKNKDLYD